MDKHQAQPVDDESGGPVSAEEAGEQLTRQRAAVRANIVGHLRDLVSSTIWRILTPLMRLVMRPRGLGVGPTILDDLQCELERDANLSHQLEALPREAAIRRRIATTLGVAASANSLFKPAELRLAIKVPVPGFEVRHEWGDYHFARALARSLAALGVYARIDLQPDWYREHQQPDHVVIVLRGLGAYDPQPQHLNLVWLISHPAAVSDEELQAYDHVFVASTSHARVLSERLGGIVTPLLQCTDPRRFRPDPEDTPQSDVVFVGNSRGEFRPIVRAAVEAGLEVQVWGTHWDEWIDDRYVRGTHVRNEDLGRLYARAGLVLNDHWRDMREAGFISNRLFDAAACGATIISDHVEGVEALFDGQVYTCEPGEDDLASVARVALYERAGRAAARARLARRIAVEHSFDARAVEILRRATVMLSGRPEGADSSAEVSAEELPDHVRAVLDEARGVELREVARKLPGPEPGRPVLVSVIRDELPMLSAFLRHYRALGINQFIFIDNGSKDGTADFLHHQADVDLWSVDRPFHWTRKQGWIHRTILEYGRDHWYLCVDADELLVYDGMERHGLHELVALMSHLGIDRVRGMLVDMYRQGPMAAKSGPVDADPTAGHELFDRDGYREEYTHRMVSRTGGPRQRRFSVPEGQLSPELTKYSLFRLGPGELMANPHHLYPYAANFESPCFLGILHYKFQAGLGAKIERAVKEENYWRGSVEYKAYAAVLEKDPDFSLAFPGSTRYRSPSDLLDAGLIDPLAWPA